MPGYYESLYGQPSAATIAAQQAAEKAASGQTNTTIAPRVVLTPEQRQANMARDLALSQTRGARPSGQDSQFYQPAYQSQYQNYANPLSAFNVSNYGTNPAMSRSMQAATAPGASGAGDYYKQLQSYASLFGTQPDKNNINFDTLLRDMRQYGISAQDLQNASSYNPASQMSQQTGKSASYPQQQFNPYTNNSSFVGGAFPTQTPFSYQPPATQPATQPQTPFSYQQPTTQPSTPFSYQTATGQPKTDYGLSYSAPMQLPQYVYDTIRDVDSYQSKPVQAYQSTRPISSGPSQAIVGRSSQIRGTPNVAAAPVAKAKGGIASLLKKHK